ncbi:MAG: hypothetical protein HC862_01575 [Scytonema sp. RU_4_4]|nr:hypothetical protein [Scytonema sp. RU_4_4]
MFSLEKAKILANICSATYESKPYQSKDAQLLLRNIKLIQPSDKTVSAPVIALSGFLNEELIIAFRGTVVSKNINQETDIFLDMLACMFCNFLPALDIHQESPNSRIGEQKIKNIDIYGCEIHIGFALLMEEILSEIQSVIEQLKPRKICLTGHSLGGALATLAAYRLKRQNFPISDVYTFGAPRVGDSAFASRYEDCKVPHFRIENKNDIVPHLPPDYQTKSKIEFTTQFFNNALNLLHNLGLPIPDELRNLQIPNLDYPPVGILKFIDLNEKIVEYSDSLRQERLFRLPKSILGIRKSQILLDHKIESYSQELNHCRIEQTKEVFMQSSEFEQIVYNIAVFGKAGVGKSSLVNYLFDKDVAKTGVGKSVTKGFEKYNFIWESIPINIYDSEGLEVGNATEWYEMLTDELKKRGTNRPVSEWFHTIFYCINAAIKRVEDFEFNIIKKLITDKYRVIVVLTHADYLTSDDTLDELENYIQEKVSSEIPIIRVCCDTKTKDKRFGDKKLHNETLRGFWYAITVRLPDKCESLLHEEVDKWCKKQAEFLNSISDINFRFKKSEIKKSVTDSFEDFIKTLKPTLYETILEEVERILSYFKNLEARLKYPRTKDFPEFAFDPKKIIPKSFIEQIISEIFAEAKSLKIIETLIYVFLNDTRPELLLKINESCQELKDEISKQKTEIAKIIEKIRRDAP